MMMYSVETKMFQKGPSILTPVSNVLMVNASSYHNFSVDELPHGYFDYAAPQKDKRNER